MSAADDARARAIETGKKAWANLRLGCTMDEVVAAVVDAVTPIIRVQSGPDQRNRPFPKQAEVEADVDRLWTQLRFSADGAAIDNHAEPQRIIVERAVKAALVCALDNRLIEVTEQWPQWIRLEPSWQAEDPAIRERLTEGPES